MSAESLIWAVHHCQTGFGQWTAWCVPQV